MAELNGTDTEEFLTALYAKARKNNDENDNESGLREVPSQMTLKGGKDQKVDFTITPEQVQESSVQGKEKITTAELVKQKKTWSELDKYIELLLDSKQTDQSVFVYLNPNSDGNPYDLQVCQYHDRSE